MTDLQLVTLIFATIALCILAAWLWHFRASRGNLQVARYQAELSLERQDRGAWVSAVDALRSSIDGRLRSLEEQIKHVPSSTDFAELEGEMRAMNIKHENVSEGQSQIRASLNRIEDYLLRGKRP